MSQQKILWDLTPLKNIQSQLDEHIHQKHQTSYEITHKKRLLALAVELNELANETKCFKYWSINKKIDSERVIDEYVDGLHFVISLLIHYQLNFEITINQWQKLNDEELSASFWHLNENLSDVNSEVTFLNWVQKFLELAYQLGYDKDQVTQAYHKKSEINFHRQKIGY